MIIYLRNNKNETVFELECWIDKEDGNSFVEISAVVDIINYSVLLLNIDDTLKPSMINDFDTLSKLRGWLWENYFMGKKNVPDEKDNVIIQLKEIINNIGTKYNLTLVTD